MPTALLVVAHPRGDSLTARVAGRVRDRLTAAGSTVDVLDLHAEGFDPRMTPADEPDWGDRDKVYSAEVRAHMARIEAADLIVVVFPVWWYGVPAILKGWIDRVWNYGFAYGRSKPRLAGKRMVWLALAGEGEKGYTATGLGDALELQLRAGVSQYCGIQDASVRFLYDAIPSGPWEEHLPAFLARADAATADLT
ncbi:NAD(P)H oxidoreductase [Spirillospora sp. NPDC127200]